MPTPNDKHLPPQLTNFNDMYNEAINDKQDAPYFQLYDKLLDIEVAVTEKQRQKNLSDMELSQLTNVNLKRIQLIKDGDNTNLEELIKVCSALGIQLKISIQ